MKAGTDIGTFKVHSTRSASTFKTDLSGVPIQGISKLSCWSNKSTWQKFYNQNIIEEV